MTASDPNRPVNVAQPKSLEEMWQDRTLPASSEAAALRAEQRGRHSLPSIREQFPELGLPSSPAPSPFKAGTPQTPARTVLAPVHGNGPEYVHSPQRMPPTSTFTTQPPNAFANHGYGHNQASCHDAAAVPRRFPNPEDFRGHWPLGNDEVRRLDSQCAEIFNRQNQHHPEAATHQAHDAYRGQPYGPPPQSTSAAYPPSTSAAYMHHTVPTPVAHPPPPPQQQQHYAPHAYHGHRSDQGHQPHHSCLQQSLPANYDRAAFPPMRAGSYEPSRQLAGLSQPFPNGGFGQMPPRHYEDYAALSGRTRSDGKVRKRRGNLPKEVTEKLRKWFHAHLHHPYPTEEEKHMMIQMTGLHMNQISNWFINARRRQLPALLRNAKAADEAARANGSSCGSMLARAPRTCRGHRARRSTTGSSLSTQLSSSDYTSSSEQLPLPLPLPQVPAHAAAQQQEQQEQQFPIQPRQSEHEEANGRIVLPYRGPRHDAGHDSHGNTP